MVAAPTTSPYVEVDIPTSSFRAREVPWNVATNAGPFRPDMFPYGQGGRPFTYDFPENITTALQTPEVQAELKAVAAAAAEAAKNPRSRGRKNPEEMTELAAAKCLNVLSDVLTERQHKKVVTFLRQHPEWVSARERWAALKQWMPATIGTEPLERVADFFRPVGHKRRSTKNGSRENPREPRGTGFRELVRCEACGRLVRRGDLYGDSSMCMRCYNEQLQDLQTAEAKKNRGPRGGFAQSERAELPSWYFLKPSTRGWPAGDPRKGARDEMHALEVIQYMTRGFGSRTDYPKLINKLAERYPVEDETNRSIWTAYRQALPRLGDKMPTVRELRSREP